MNTESMITEISNLGEAKIPTPVQKRADGMEGISFVTDQDRVVIEIDDRRVIRMIKEGQNLPCFELAGPRRQIFFDPSKLKCALVSCGGLCPGLNDIIRSIVLELHYGYGVRNIFGIRYGLQGFIAGYGHDLVDLTPEGFTEEHRSGVIPEKQLDQKRYIAEYLGIGRGDKAQPAPGSHPQGTDEDAQEKGDNPGQKTYFDGQPQSLQQPDAIRLTPQDPPVEIVCKTH